MDQLAVREWIMVWLGLFDSDMFGQSVVDWNVVKNRESISFDMQSIGKSRESNWKSAIMEANRI